MSKNYTLSVGKISVVVALADDAEALKIAEQYGKDAKIEEYTNQDVAPVVAKDLRSLVPVPAEKPANN